MSKESNRRVSKRRARTEILKKQFGGKWKYDRKHHIWRDDNDRVVYNIANGVDEFDNPLPGPQQACMTSGKIYHHFYWYQLEFEQETTKCESKETIIQEKGGKTE